MDRCKNGLYRRVRGKEYVELLAKKSDSYDRLLERGKDKLKMEHPAIILRASGAIVDNSRLCIDGQSQPWTLGNYIRHLHMCPEKLKLGIARQSCRESDSEDESDLESDSICVGKVSKEHTWMALYTDNPTMKYVWHCIGVVLISVCCHVLIQIDYL